MILFLEIVFIVICTLLIVIVNAQEGKSQSFGFINDSDSYWSKNKLRSVDNFVIIITWILGILFFILSIVLNKINL